LDLIDSIESLAYGHGCFDKNIIMKVIALVALIAGAAPIPKMKKPEPGPELHPAITKSHKGGISY
jgi:hypothetical protein